MWQERKSKSKGSVKKNSTLFAQNVSPHLIKEVYQSILKIKIKNYVNLLILVLYQTCMTLFLLWNIENILKSVGYQTVLDPLSTEDLLHTLLQSLDFFFVVYYKPFFFLCFVLVFMKPLLTKSAMWSDWSAGSVSCDWSTSKCHSPEHNYWVRPKS